jgi:hypothetical protein
MQVQVFVGKEFLMVMKLTTIDSGSYTFVYIT